MNAASLQSSERLQRVDALLADGRQWSTMDIIQICSVCAVNSIVSELRENGRKISTHQQNRIWYYQRTDIEPTHG